MKRIMTGIFALSMMACSTQKSEVKSTSPDGNTNIVVNAERLGSIGAWETEIHITSKDFEGGNLKAQIYAPAIDKNHVKFDWKRKDFCLIRFTLNDGKERIFQAYSDETRLHLSEAGTSDH